MAETERDDSTPTDRLPPKFSSTDFRDEDPWNPGLGYGFIWKVDNGRSGVEFFVGLVRSLQKLGTPRSRHKCNQNFRVRTNDNLRLL
jgi:hypothetical protein